MNDPSGSQPAASETYSKAETAFRRGDLDAAISLCRRMLESGADSAAAFDLLAASLHHAGRLREEIETMKSALAAGEGKPALYRNLGDLQRIAGDSREAVETLWRAGEMAPGDRAIRLSLAMALYDAGDLPTAKNEFTRILKEDPTCAPAHYYLGKIHWKSADRQQARQAFIRALDCDANYPPANRELAELLYLQVYQQPKTEALTADLEQAAELIGRAIERGADDFVAFLLAGKILIELERFSDAARVLEHAMEMGDKDADLYIALSIAYAGLGKDSKARRITRRLLREFPTGSRICTSPEAEVLVLETLSDAGLVYPLYGYLAYANSNTIGALAPDRVSLHHVYIQELTGERIGSFKAKYGVIYNNVDNAEKNAQRGYSRTVQHIIDRTGLPVVNPPALVDLTTRDKTYERLHEIERLIAPRTMAVAPGVDNLVGILLRVESEFEFPVLVRNVGSHRAANIEKVDDMDALQKVLARHAGRSCYIIQYHESRYSAESFRRYRAVFINGKMFPERMVLSANWLVGTVETRLDQKQLMEEDSGFQRDEMRWQADPQGTLGEANVAALYAANDVIGLDVYGIDLGIAGDGRVIVFEANPCMNCLAIQKHIPKFPYLETAAHNIKTALEDLLIERARGRA